jgi:hypothetical protein
VEVTPSVTEEKLEPGETGTCEKCDSQISLEADRCPECGHEPGSHGIIMSILVYLSILWAGFITLIVVLTWGILIPFEGFPITDAVAATVGVLLFASPALGILAVAVWAERKTPTGRTKSWSQVWEEANSD